MNRIQSQHAPLAFRYVARNPFLTSPGVLQNCPEIAENTLMTRYTAGAARYYPISDNLTTADSHFGTYSAACAVHVYRGDALPEAYRGAAFSCDPTGNLVRGDRLEKSGGTFAARRIYEDTEALRSRDNWFRPVFIADGPDGALYIADMYRSVIEHPEYLPGDVRKHVDFEAGKDKGRIWRLSGTSNVQRPTLKLESANVPALVAELSSPIPWRRDTAFRLLVERNDPATAALLRKSLRASDASGPAVAKLRLLELEGGVDEPTLLVALKHPQPAVRQNAVRSAEASLATNAVLRGLVLKLADDPDPHVRFQVALSLGEARSTEVVPAIVRIAAKQASDRWTRAAILSALPARTNALRLLGQIARAREPLPEGYIALAGDLGRQLGSGVESSTMASAYEEMARGLTVASDGMTIAANLGFANTAGSEFRRIAGSNSTRFTSLLAQARSLAGATSTLPDLRVASAELLAFDDSTDATTLLSGLLGAHQSREVQRAAARSLLQPSRLAGLPPLLTAERWNAYTPGVRSMFLDRLAGVPEFAALLLDALESGHVPVSALTSAQREQLRKAKNPAVKSRAEKLLAAPGGNRESAFAEAKSALKLTPAPPNGRAVFEKACAACHRLNQQGVAVGPDLFDIRQQPKESILYHIVIPEAEIAPNFVNYECELKDGRTLSGLLASETAANITLRMGQGVEENIPRAQIARLTASRLSLMPQELERTMTAQDLADLLAYLKGEQ
jgi:putative heme-binding domain-containing protein